ncbi:MAG: hypothetical protein ABL958_10070, partial [Bdellovibrionia bacterium]
VSYLDWGDRRRSRRNLRELERRFDEDDDFPSTGIPVTPERRPQMPTEPEVRPVLHPNPPEMLQ